MHTAMTEQKNILAVSVGSIAGVNGFVELLDLKAILACFVLGFCEGSLKLWHRIDLNECAQCVRSPYGFEEKGIGR